MIHERGYWLDKTETDTHMFDAELCRAIISMFSFQHKLIDIGCGNGSYTKEFIKAGFDCIGYDGSPLTPEISDGLCHVMDFSKPVDVGVYDVVICLEVGEHIPAEYEDVFIRNLVIACSDYLVISWGIEGQPGTGHVNCRNNDYIIEKIENLGMTYHPKLSETLRSLSTFRWFKDTLMIFTW
jgi:hypothetical protein